MAAGGDQLEQRCTGDTPRFDTFARVSMGGRRRIRSDHGFTLLELLVVMIIIAILSAIALPVFFRQRDKGLVAQSQSALANAKLTAEAYYVGDGDGSYAGLEVPGVLESEGLRLADTVVLAVGADPDEYCIVAVNLALPVGHDWKTSSIHSQGPAPTDDDDCSGA